MTTTGIIKVLPDLPPQPSRTAVMVSIGFHGLVFATLALISTTPPAKEDQEIVNLVSLSPSEQSRLPEFATSTALPSPTGLTAIPGTTATLTPRVTDPKFNFGPLPALTLPNVPLSSPPVYLPSPQVLLPPIRNYQTPPSPNNPNLPRLGVPPQPNVMASPETPLILPSPTPAAMNFKATIKPGKNDQEALGQLPIWFIQARKTANADTIKYNFRAEVPPFPYPPNACKDKLAGRVSVAVLVSPQGRLVELPANSTALNQSGGLQANPQVMMTSQENLLDQAAIAFVRGIKFETADRYQALIYTLEYKYSKALCGAAPPSPAVTSPQPSPATSESPTSSEVNPTQTPTTSPSASPSTPSLPLRQQPR
jgi:hypothetical protein